MEAIGTAAGVVGLVTSVIKLTTALNSVRKRYNYAAPHTTGITSSLWTIKAALEAIEDLRISSKDTSQCSRQLDSDLEISLQSCALLVAVIERKLAETNLAKPTFWDNISFVGLDATYKDFESNLDAQVRALHLLLTIFQCRTGSEQRVKVEHEQTRSVFRQILDSTASLRLEDQDLQDAASILSEDPSVNLSVDAILLSTPLYQKVYKKRFPKSSAPQPIAVRSTRKPQGHSKSNSASSVSKRSSERPVDPFVTENLGLPFLGIPFQGESPSFILEEDYNSEGDGAEDEADDKNLNELPGGYTKEESYGFSQSPLGIRISPPSEINGERNFANSHAKWENTNASPKETSLLGAGSITIDKQSALETTSNHRDILSQPDVMTSNLPGPKLSAMQTLESRSAVSSYVNQRGCLSILEDEEFSKSQYSPGIAQQNKEPAVREEPKHMPLEILEEHAQEKEQEAVLPQSNNAQPQTPDRPSQLLYVQGKADSAHVEHSTVKPSTTGNAQNLSIHGTPLDNIIGKHQQSCKFGRDETSEVFHINFGPGPRLDITDLHSQIINNQENISNIRTPTCTIGVADRDSTLAGEEPFSSPPNPVSHPVIPLSPVKNTTQEPASPTRSPRPVPSAFSEPTSPFRSPLLVPRAAVESTSPTRPPPPVPDIVLDSSASEKKANLAEKPDEPTGEEFNNIADVSLQSSEVLSAGTDDSVTFIGSEIWERMTYPKNTTIPTSAISFSTGSLAVNPEQSISNIGQTSINHNRSRSKSSLQSVKNSLTESIAVRHRTSLSDSSGSTTMTKRLSRLSSMARGSIIGLSRQSEKSSAINAAASAANIQLLEQLLADNPRLVNSMTSQPVSSGVYQTRTPLMSAVLAGHLESIDVLKRHHADIFAIDKQGRTALHLAVEKRRHEVVTSLLQFAVAPVAEKQRSRTANFIDASDDNGLTALHIAAREGNYDIVQILIAAGANAQLADALGRQPLHLAIAGRHESIVAELLTCGVAIDAADAVGQTCLMLAVRNSDTLTMASLISAGASVTVRDSNGDTVIHHAAQVGHLQAIEILPTQASDFEMKNNQGERPLHVACSKQQRMIVSALLERGAQVNAWTEPSNSKQRMFSKPNSDAKSLSLPATPFHLACFYGHYDCAVILMRHGAWLHATLEDTRTPLMLAVQSHNPHLVSLLLEKGAKVNAATSKECLTALHFACCQGDLEITKMLISYGANTFALTTHNPPETPASYAYKWISPPPGGKIDTNKWAAADFAAATSTNLRSAKMGLGPQHSLTDEGHDFYQSGLLDPNGHSTGSGLVLPGFQPISANQPQSFRASSARSSF